jgi:C-terminal processing protease CtpA/Prc
MPMVRLPGSKLNIRLGLACIKPYYKTSIEGRGIFPDVAIKATLQDRINGNDPELNWVLDDIKGRHSGGKKDEETSNL